MTRWWKNAKLQVKFTLVVGAGVLMLAASAVAVVDYFESANLENTLRTSSVDELNSLSSLVESTMKMRLDDPQDIAIKVFNGWFESRNNEYAGKLWSVWGPGVAAYMEKAAPERSLKRPVDAIDEEVMRTKQPVGRFIDGAYRYSVPIVMGVTAITKQAPALDVTAPVWG